MADAEVIPLGTRGRPGRGTGSAKPSAAARNLAGATKRPAKPRAARPSTEPPQRTDSEPAERQSTDSGPIEPQPSERRPTERRPTERRSTERRATRSAPTRPKSPKRQPTRPTAVEGEPAERASAKPRSATRSRQIGLEPVPGPGLGAGSAAETADAAGAVPSASSIDAEAGQGSPPEPDERPGDTSDTTATDRAPGAGIPVSDWLTAFSGAAKELFGEQWEARLADFLAFLRRRATGDYTVDEFGFDREVTERFFLSAIRPIAQKWFRVEVRGADNIPTEGGALVVSNHSGTVPMDGLMTAVSIHDHTGRHLRPLGADLVFRLPVVGEMARKGGATLACNDDAERMLRGGELVGVWPEGFKGIGKPYSERYKLQRFGRGGFVSAAMRTGVPIVPCSVVGAEEIYPLVGNMPSLARLLGVPYIPITPFFPLLGPLGLVPLPSKWLIEFGEPIRTDSYDEGAADDPMLVFNVTDQVRETIQQTLYSLLMQRRSVFY